MTLDGEISDFIGIYANNNDNAHLIKIIKPVPKKNKLNETMMSTMMSGIEQSMLEASYMEQSIVEASVVEEDDHAAPAVN